MLVTAILLAFIAAIVDYFWGIKEPWRKIIFAGIVILFVLGLIMIFIPLPVLRLY
jgi:hypothetical protein